MPDGMVPVSFVSSNVFQGGISSVVLPDPIPNSEVKRAWADDSPTHVGAKVGSCPFMINPPSPGGFFFWLVLFYTKDMYGIYVVFLLLMMAFALLMLFIITSAFLGFLLTRVPFVPTYRSDIEFIVKKLGISSADSFYDLGSGDGKVVFLVEELSGARTKGFELTWWTHLLAKFKKYLRRSKAQLLNQNFFKHSWSDANYIYGYLYPPLMGRVEQKFLAECKPGSVAIIRDFPFPNLRPADTYYLPKRHEIYIYKI